MSQSPIHIRVSRDDGLMEIDWKDGPSSSITLARLRRLCPCAVCESAREAEDGLSIITPEQLGATAEIENIVRVGRYAVQIVWSGGHDSGIYTYDYLRSLGHRPGSDS